VLSVLLAGLGNGQALEISQKLPAAELSEAPGAIRYLVYESLGSATPLEVVDLFPGNYAFVQDGAQVRINAELADTLDARDLWLQLVVDGAPRGERVALDAVALGITFAFGNSLDMDNNSITGLEMPAEPGGGLDAANRAYVLNKVAAGNAATATALAGDGADCPSGHYPLGVDAQGNVQGCTADQLGSSQWVTSGPNIYYPAGNVGIQRTSPQARLDILGGNWDVANGEGDLRIGDASTRLKIGIATGGGGTGSATIMEQGPAGAYNVLSLGTQGNKVLHVNGTTQRVGIGTDAPTAPLGFPATLGRKITLYPGASGDVGLGVAGNRLQIYADNPNADVALGYDAAGTFNERFAVKANGALAVSGNTGTQGQVLQSNGGGAAASWVSPAASLYQVLNSTNYLIPVDGGDTPIGMSQDVSVPGNARALVSITLAIGDSYCVVCGGTQGYVGIVLDGVVQQYIRWELSNGQHIGVSGQRIVDLTPGTHTISLVARATGKNAYTGYPPAPYGNVMIVQVFPQ